MKPSVRFSRHAKTVMAERAIEEAWVMSALREPEAVCQTSDGFHCFRRIQQHDNRVLHVVLNGPLTESTARAVCVVTAFFDRRAKGLAPGQWVQLLKGR